MVSNEEKNGRERNGKPPDLRHPRPPQTGGRHVRDHADRPVHHLVRVLVCTGLRFARLIVCSHTNCSFLSFFDENFSTRIDGQVLWRAKAGVLFSTGVQTVPRKACCVLCVSCSVVDQTHVCIFAGIFGWVASGVWGILRLELKGDLWRLVCRASAGAYPLTIFPGDPSDPSYYCGSTIPGDPSYGAGRICMILAGVTAWMVAVITARAAQYQQSVPLGVLQGEAELTAALNGDGDGDYSKL